MDGRVIVHWIAEVFADQGGHKIAVRGHTHDVSLAGATLFIEDNFTSKNPVTLAMRIPSGKSLAEWATIQVNCRIALVIAEDEHFRMDLQFLSFVGNGKQILEAAMKERNAFSGAK